MLRVPERRAWGALPLALLLALPSVAQPSGGAGALGAEAALRRLVRAPTGEARERAAELARELRDAAYRASVAIAREKGAFPRFDPRLLDSGMARRLPEAIRAEIAAIDGLDRGKAGRGGTDPASK